MSRLRYPHFVSQAADGVPVDKHLPSSVGYATTGPKDGLSNDGRARPAFQHVARPQHHQLVAPQDAALTVDGADAIAIAVEGDAEIGLDLGDLVLELDQVMRLGRIGVMRRKLTCR